MMSGFFGSTFTSAKSLPRPHGRASSLTRRQLSPASSDLYKPPICGDPSQRALILFGSLGATQKPIRPRPCSKVGSPLVSCRHVLPPSVDLKSPLFGPCHWPFSHGPCRPAHRSA